MKPPRGEVWLVDLTPIRGHQQAGKRPCLVISDDIYNHGPAEKHIVLPITSHDKGIPYHMAIHPPEGGLRTTSYVLCDDIRSVSRDRFLKRLGVVSTGAMNAGRLNVEILLGW